jgi:hypothetical protein
MHTLCRRRLRRLFRPTQIAREKGNFLQCCNTYRDSKKLGFCFDERSFTWLMSREPVRFAH